MKLAPGLTHVYMPEEITNPAYTDDTVYKFCHCTLLVKCLISRYIKTKETCEGFIASLMGKSEKEFHIVCNDGSLFTNLTKMFDTINNFLPSFM